MVRYVDQDEPVMVLVSSILPTEDTQHSFSVMLAEDNVVEVPAAQRELFDYLRAGQLYSDSLQWVTSRGGNEKTITGLVKAGHVRILPPGPSPEMLSALNGLRLVPLGVKVEVPDLLSNLVAIGKDSSTTDPVFPSWLLGAVLWESQAGEDFPHAVRRLGKRQPPTDGMDSREKDLFGGVLSEAQMIRMSFTWLDVLLSEGLVRFEQVEAPTKNLFSKLLGR